MSRGPLAKLSKLCLALPEATIERADDYASFRVRKKVFAYFLDDHHGDGRVSLCWKAELGENEELAEADPKRFYVPAYIGHRGWGALRLDVSAVDWEEVAELVVASYRAVAPKKLAETLDATSLPGAAEVPRALRRGSDSPVPRGARRRARSRARRE